MKKILVLFLFTLIYQTSFSQSRTNKVIPKFEESSPEIKKAVGWALNNTTGKWIENANCIFQSEVSKYTISMIPQKFNWIKINKIIYNELTYYVFLYETNSGRYKYPSIKKDWEVEKQMQFLLLSDGEYSSLKEEINKQNGLEIKISSKLHGYFSDRYNVLGGENIYNEENLIARIVKVIENPDYFEYCILLNSQKVDNLDVIRFKLPNNSCSLKKNYLENQYYEISRIEFLKMFIY